MNLRDVAVTGAFLLGALAIIGALGHWMGVTMKALAENRGYDVRLGDMLAIGLLVFVLGAAMVAGAWQAKQDGSGLILAGTASGFVVVLLLVLWRVIFTGPEGSVVGGTIILLLYAAEVVIAFMAR